MTQSRIGSSQATLQAGPARARWVSSVRAALFYRSRGAFAAVRIKVLFEGRVSATSIDSGGGDLVRQCGIVTHTAKIGSGVSPFLTS